MHAERVGDLLGAAAVVEPRAQGRGELGLRAGREREQRRELGLRELVGQRPVGVDEQRREVVAGADEPARQPPGTPPARLLAGLLLAVALVALVVWVGAELLM